MILGGVTVYPEKYPAPTITFQQEWGELSSGSPVCADMGKNYDLYTSSIGIIDTLENINTIIDALESGDGSITYSPGNNEYIFGPHINHTSFNTLTISDRSDIERINFKLYKFKIKAHPGSAPSLATVVVPSLINIGRVESIAGKTNLSDGIMSTPILNRTFAQYQTDNKTGSFIITLLYTTDEMRTTLYHIVNTLRGTKFTMPSFPGYEYPFGKSAGTGPFTVRIRNLDYSQSQDHLWILKLEFRLVR